MINAVLIRMHSICLITISYVINSANLIGQKNLVNYIAQGNYYTTETKFYI